MGQPLQVNVAGLQSLGGDVLSHGEALSAIAGRMAPLGPGVAGWATSDAAQAAGKGWGEFLTGLAGRTSQAGQSLIDAANNYQRADERAGNRHGGWARYQ